LDKKLRLSLIFQAAGNVRGFLGGVRSETDRTTKALGQARERVQALQRATKDVGAFRALEARLAGTRNELAEARAEALRLGNAMDAAENPTKQLSRAFELATNKVRALETQQSGQVRGLGELKTKLEAAGVSTAALGAHEMRLTRDLKAANAELATQGRRMNDVADRQRRMAAARGQYDRTQQFAGSAMGAGASAIGAGTVAAAPLFISARAGMSFEDGMADIRKVVDFETPQQFRQMENDILNLSTRIPLASEGIAAIVASAGQAGIARRELMGFAEDAGKMGIAFDTTAEDAGEKMATWRTAFRMTQPQVRGLADQINYLGNTGPANALQISNIVTRIGPLGEVAGLAAGEIAALGSTIAGMGVEEEIAATGIKNTMLALTKGTAATKAQRKAYAALGLEAEAVSRRMQVDAGGTIVDVMERISKLKPDQQSAILTQLFGSESVAAIAPMLTNLELLRGNLAKVADESLFAGSMQKEFESRASTASNAAKLGMQGLKAVATEVGIAFLPTIKAGALALRDMSQGIRGFAAANPGAIKVLGVLVGLVSAGLFVFGGLAIAVAAILGPFALLQLAWTGALPLLTAVAGGITAAAGAVWTFTAALLANPVTWIVIAVVALAAAALLIYRNWGKISAWWNGVWPGISAAVGNALSTMGRLFMNFSPLGLLLGAIMRAWPALQALGGRFMSLGRHLLSGLINGVLGGIPALLRAVMSAGGSIITGFKNRLGIRSPSRVFAQLGDYTMQGMGVGIDRSADQPLRRMRAFATAMTAAGAIAAPGAAFANPPDFTARPAIDFQSAGRMQTPAAGGSAARGSAPPVFNITVNAAPGMDEERLVQMLLDRLRREMGGGGGQFGDDDFGEAP
jgi:TP901 family phage tail tape measure protein